MDSPFVKVFGSPGIDSHTDEVGLFNSGAGLSPHTGTAKASPWDWWNEAPTQHYETENLIGNFSATKAPNAKSIAVRKRGLSPWEGFFPGKRASVIYQHPGGIADMNPGADSRIAGGPGAASSFCRMHGVRDNRGMKLPVLPQEITRGGLAPMPTGGGGHDSLSAPLKPKVPGWPTIFSFRPKD